MAKNPLSRAKFAANCVELIQDYGFDGIDIGVYNLHLELLGSMHPFCLIIQITVSLTIRLGISWIR